MTDELVALIVVAVVGCGSDKAPRSASPEPIPEPAPEVSSERPRRATTPEPPIVRDAIVEGMALIPRRRGTPEFYLDVHEVTVGEYADCIDGGGCSRPPLAPTCDGNANNFLNERTAHPLNCITVVEAWNYCHYRGKRLPSSDEFVVATRSEKDLHAPYPWGSAMPTCAVAVLAGCGYTGTSPVGSKPAGTSKDGVQDLIGNVAELVGDPPGLAYDARVRYFDPELDEHVLGGSYASEKTYVGEEVIHTPSPQVGFRCASSTPGKPQKATNY